MIERESPRVFFARLVRASADAGPRRPSAEAVSYLVGLLEDRVRASGGPTGEAPPSLAEALLEARLEGRAERLRRLRAVGDRALFVSGFFGESLNRSLVDLDYYRSVGRSAYADVAASLARGRGAQLFEELAERFRDLVEVLAQVAEHTAPRRADDLLRLFERYLRTGSRRDRDRLLQRGLVPPQPGEVRFRQ